MPIGNRFELLDQQSYLGQTVINAYFYRAVAGTSISAVDLISHFVFYMLPALVAIQNDSLVHQLIACRNLDVPTDFSVFAPLSGNVGLVVGDGAPPFVAWAFRLNRTRTDVHHGAKRIAGVSEPWVTDGVADASILASLNAFSGLYQANLVGVDGSNYEPRIMRRLLDSSGHLIGYEDFEAGSASYVRVSSQNTRKFGRGA